jgi:hypothetical protein
MLTRNKVTKYFEEKWCPYIQIFFLPVVGLLQKRKTVSFFLLIDYLIAINVLNTHDCLVGGWLID